MAICVAILNHASSLFNVVVLARPIRLPYDNRKFVFSRETDIA